MCLLPQAFGIRHQKLIKSYIEILSTFLRPLGGRSESFKDRGGNEVVLPLKGLFLQLIIFSMYSKTKLGKPLNVIQFHTDRVNFPLTEGFTLSAFEQETGVE